MAGRLDGRRPEREAAARWLARSRSD